MALPVNVRDIMSSGGKIREEREKPVHLELWMEHDVAEPLLDAIRAAFRPETSQARMHVEVIQAPTALRPDPLADAVIAVVGSGTVIGPSLLTSREAGVPTAAVVWTEASREEWANALGHPVRDTLAHAQPEHLVNVILGEWLAETLHSKRLALANNFAFMRRAVAVEAIQATSMQNAAIGVAPFLPGADMPVMTANQMKMMLQIAGAYGEPLSAERIRELVAVLGGAFVFRAIARTVAGFIPVLGWAIRGGIGYSGTMAVGLAAVEYFESGGNAEGLAAKMREVRARLRRERRGEPIVVEVVSVEDVVEPKALPAEQTGMGA